MHHIRTTARAALLLVPMLFTAGCGMPSFLLTPVANATELREEVVEPGKGFSPAKIAVIEVEGTLADTRQSGLFQAGENDLSLFVQQLTVAENDDDVKAVVLRVNSPGGTVTTSDTMYQLVMRFKQKTHKPVIAAAQEVCASGAYYVSCAADTIVVHPTSIVGSIGVIFTGFEFKDTLDKLGIHINSIHSGPLKEMGSPFKHETDEERQLMQQMIDEYFARFEKVVTDNRPVKEKPPAAMAADYQGIYSGRVFSGAQAVALGLADRTGLLSDAIDLARQKAGAPDAEVIMYRRPYGYGGSIYAHAEPQPPQAGTLQLNLPGAEELLPTGFYYLWQP